jgi:hypothetical protein
VLGNKTAFHFKMPRKKVVRIADVPVAEETPQEPQEPAKVEPEPAKEPAKVEPAKVEPAKVEPAKEPEKPAPKKRAPPKSRMVRRTTQQMKKAQEIEYMVTRIANELRKDGWAAPPPPQAAAPAPPARRQVPRTNRGTKHIELRDVLRRHNVPNKYRRAPGEYLQQYEDEEDEVVAAPVAAAYDDEEEAEEEEEDLFREPKAVRFVPQTNDKVSSVYSQIFGAY